MWQWAALVPLSEVSPHSSPCLGQQAENALCCDLSVPPTPLPAPHSHPGPPWEKRREDGQEVLGPGSRRGTGLG